MMRARNLVGAIGILSALVILWSFVKEDRISCPSPSPPTPGAADSALVASADGVASAIVCPPVPECPVPPQDAVTAVVPAPPTAPAPDSGELQQQLDAARQREADLLSVIRVIQPEPPPAPPPGSRLDQVPSGHCICPGCSCGFFYNRMGYLPTPETIAEKDQTNYAGPCDRFSERKKEYVVVFDAHDDWFPDELVQPVLSCKCGIRCKWTKSTSDAAIKLADAFVYFSNDPDPQPQRRPDLYMVSYYLEPPPKSGYYNPDDQRPRHLSMNYRLNSSVPITYFEYNIDPKKTLAMRSTQKSTEFPAMAMMSNCKDPHAVERATLVAELQKYMPVKVLGQAAPHDPRYGCEFLQNHQLPVAAHPECPDITHHGTKTSKICVMSKYKFYLAVESCLSWDYVTEKLIWAFEAGVIPIYRGTPSARQFIPGNNSVIFWDDFPTVKDLADYIMKVNNDQALYDSYFEYLNHPLNPGFLRARELSWDTGFCRLCEKLSELDRIRETAWSVGQEMHARPRKGDLY